MGLEVSKEAALWYKEEMDLQEGDYVQFYVQLYGGIPTSHPNFYLGVTTGLEGNIAMKDVVEGITFYLNDEHSWALDEFDLKITLNNGEIDVLFNKK